MPITESDIRIYKSSVMLDVPEGGGPMSGQVVTDGVSNDMFPDTSEPDRALGRVQFRSVFGVAETANTDTLLGTHALITEPPTDPLVHAAIIKPTAWGGTVTDYKAQVERYLLKGTRITSRLLDTHYAGSVALQLISMSGTDFPAANDVIVLVHPDGTTPDQYVRCLTVTKAQQSFTVVESGVTTFTAWVATVGLALPLASDQPGPPASRAVSDESPYTKLYSTTRAAGASFYSLRPLAAEAASGALSATVDTVFHPIVPAAQVESPLIDLLPYQALAAVARTATGFVVLPEATVNAVPGFVWRLPTAIEAGSLSINHGGTVLTDYLGALRSGPTTVGVVDYVAGTATLDASAPAYGSAGSVVTYKPGTQASGVLHSRDVLVTTSNSGLSWVQDMEPKPMPGSVVVEYMVQGQWYSLRDVGGAGKLVGASADHGTGSVNYASGSLAATLGAIPDTDSSILYTWATAESAAAVGGSQPPRATTSGTATRTGAVSGEAYTIESLAWTANGAARTATVTAGVLSGDATGRAVGGQLYDFAPTEVPDAASVTWEGQRYTPAASGSVAAPTSGTTASLGATGLATADGWLGIQLSASGTQLGFDPVVRARVINSDVVLYPWGVVVGSVNLSTGAITLNSTATLTASTAAGVLTGTLGGVDLAYRYTYTTGDPITVNVVGFSSVPGYSDTIFYTAPASNTPTTGTVALSSAWEVLQPTGRASAQVPVLPASVVASVFGTVLTVSGQPRLGWHVGTGTADATGGSFDASLGRLSLDNPPSGSPTALTLHNMAQSRSAPYLTQGVFRTATAPLKAGSMQLSSNSLTATVDNSGNITGDFVGSVDFERGIVRWQRATASSPGFNAAWLAAIGYAATEGATPDSFSYNAVFLQYLPMDAATLGLDTSRLPLDGRVPYVRTGDLAVVHNTLTTTLPNPVTLSAVQSLGRTRIAAVKVVDSAGAKVASDRYTTDLDAGTITFVASLAAYTQPLTVHHRIEDMMRVSKVDISGQVKFTRPLTHTFPAGTSYLSSVLLVGDVQARAYGQFEQEAWTGEWSDSLTSAAILANYNEITGPIAVTNAGAIPERWACIFTSSTSYRVVGESVGEIATGSTLTDTAPVNPATMAPYFTLPTAGWGTGWAAGNVMRFNTRAAGANFVVVRTVLQGPATASSDQFTLAFRGDVNA